MLKYTQNDWPDQWDPVLKPFNSRRQELTVEAGCLLWGIRVIVPEKLRTAVLEELRTSHLGIVRMKSLACLHVWWPVIKRNIEETVHSCSS